MRRDYAATTIRSYVQIVDAFRQQAAGFGVTSADPITLVGMLAVLTTIAALPATYPPAASPHRSGGGPARQLALTLHLTHQ
jgi:hypothetical protein